MNIVHTFAWARFQYLTAIHHAIRTGNPTAAYVYARMLGRIAS